MRLTFVHTDYAANHDLSQFITVLFTELCIFISTSALLPSYC